MIKKSIAVFAMIPFIVGCVREGDHYKVTLGTIIDGIQSLKHQSDLKNDEEALNKELVPKKGIDISRVRDTFIKYEKFNNLSRTDRKYNSCRATIQKANQKGNELKAFYSQNREILDEYTSSRAMSAVFAGMGALGCAASFSCRIVTSLNTERVGAQEMMKGIGAIYNAGANGIFKGELERKGISIAAANQVVKEYSALSKITKSYYNNAIPCVNYVQHKESEVDDALYAYAKYCFNENWFDMKTDEGKHNACSAFLTKGIYKKYI